MIDVLVEAVDTSTTHPRLPARSDRQIQPERCIQKAGSLHRESIQCHAGTGLVRKRVWIGGRYRIAHWLRDACGPGLEANGIGMADTLVRLQYGSCGSLMDG